MTGDLDGHGKERYRCGKKQYQDIQAAHVRRSVLAAAIEPDVWAAVERVLRNPALIAQEVERQRQDAGSQQTALDRERRHYAAQLAQCDRDLKRWEAAYLGEAIDLQDFKVKKAEVDARRASAERELARLDAEQRQMEDAALELATLTDYCREVAENLRTFDLADKRLALEALGVEVVWHPERPLAITAHLLVGSEKDVVR
jgi:chromosome segregation ATPase